MATGCAADARTVTTRRSDNFEPPWILELRWSPTCQTNWVRVAWSNYRSLTAVKRRRYSGNRWRTVRTSGFVSSNANASWTGMIYSPDAPNFCVRGELQTAVAGRYSTNCY